MKSQVACTSTPSRSSRSTAMLPAQRRDILHATTSAIGLVVLPSRPSKSQAEVSNVPILDQKQIPREQLKGGLEVSRIIKGCWQLSGGHSGEPSSDRTRGKAALEDFATFEQAGITTFDTADHYGPSELLIGEYLRKRSPTDTGVQVLTKFCYFGGTDNLDANIRGVRSRLFKSLNRLGVKQLDMAQFYWGDYENTGYLEVAKALAQLQAEGLIKHVGLTNFDVERMERMEQVGLQVVSNQVQYSLLDRRPNNLMVDYCQQRGISLLPYGALGGGFLSERYLDMQPNDISYDTFSKRKYASVIRQAGGWQWYQQLLQGLQRIALKHDTSVSNIATRWVLDQASVPAVIVGARNARHVDDHRSLFLFELDSEDQASLQQILLKGRASRGDCYGWERGGYW